MADELNSYASILIVDDISDNLRLLSATLSQYGYRTRVATNGPRALESARANPPDLILLDIMMPEMDGFEVCARLKETPELRDVPVIFISALGEMNDKIRAFKSGGVDYLIKPIQVEELVARVNTHLSLRRLREDLKHELVLRERAIQDLDEANVQLQREIKERQDAEMALELSREHFRTVADFTYNWEYWMGPGGYPVYISPSCQRITGYRREEFQKDPGLLVNIAHPEDRPHWIAHLNQDARGTELGSFNLRIITREGEERWLGHSCQPVYNRDGEWLGRRASNRDITEQIHAEMQLRQYASELEAQNAELDAFAHTVAHDLKSPLTSLVGFSQLLNERMAAMTPQQIQIATQAIYQGAHKMADIITSLLLLASVRKLTEVEIAPLDMGKIVHEVQVRLEALISEYHCELRIPESWRLAVGYGPWLEEVWANYISNAIKYGGEPPCVELGSDLVHGDATQVRFWVRDNGKGLLPEQQARLFTPFERLSQIQIKGHGLGLSIVKRIVEKLGGQVGVHSQMGQGSLFYFTLPATVPDILPNDKTPL